MNEERKRILEMLSSGKINVEEANQLLDATLNEEVNAALSNKSSKGKFLYVTVEPKDTEDGKKLGKVSVKVPYALINAGFNIAGLIPKDAQKQINEGLKEQGMNFDFSNFNPENIKEIMESLEQLTVEVDNVDSLIRVYSK